jgi:hypothetical protein
MTVAIVIVIGLNGETNWFEGTMLLAVYAILGITFFYIPTPRSGGYDKGATTEAAGELPAMVREPAGQ